MDPVRAKHMSAALTGKYVGGWLIHRYVGDGRSAVVFEGEKDGRKAAVKIYDPELVERFGRATQLRRIERERLLIGLHHPNLVQIFDGGECGESGHLYVALEFIAAPNLAQCLTLVPRDKIASIIHQIASAARFLEELQLAHRDIKPQNIAIFPDFSKAVLLDLGVIRPFGDGSLTDDNARVFVGTLRYSSPEFLLREEIDSPEGWRAITFYQLGAVLHDLIMRRPLFQEFSEPYAKLVDAVKNVTPKIHADDVSPDLVLLAQKCLVKSPEKRLDLLSWKDFDLKSNNGATRDSVRERVKNRILLTRSLLNATDSSPRQSTEPIHQLVCRRLEAIIRDECVGCGYFPPIELKTTVDGEIQVTLVFAASVSHQLPKQLSIRFDCEVVDEATAAVSIHASACLLPTGASHGNPHASATVFRGPMDSKVLDTRVQDLLWCAIDLAQQAPSASAEDVYWLDLGGVMEG